jgi:hypothetical protein
VEDNEVYMDMWWHWEKQKYILGMDRRREDERVGKMIKNEF